MTARAARRTYPQVDPGAAGLLNVRLGRAPARATVGQALGLARLRSAALIRVGETGWVLREDLNRAQSLGLDALPAAAVARGLPAVGIDESEVRVRRLLASGAPAVIVRDRRGPVGAVTPPPGRAASSLLGRWFVERLPEGARTILEAATGLAAEQGGRAFLAGGTVRDTVRGTATAQHGRDIDIIIEGDGVMVARALAAALGLSSERAPLEHGRFLTASLTWPPDRRVDVATARSERYERPGALPRVLPATIGQDLARRDFTINAMAVELGPEGFGLLDPFGGRDDLGRRRLRVLHPLSFVEDPTRIFRAARYGARLGFSLETWTARAQTLALRLGPYPALSGQRLAAEIDLILADDRPELALRRLGIAGAFRLLDSRFRFTRLTAARMGTLPRGLAWLRGRSLHVAPLELAALVLAADQIPDVASMLLGRLGFTGEPRARLERALAEWREVASRVERARRPSERAGPLWDRSDVELAWLAFVGRAAARSAVEWFLASARGVRPALSGDDVIGLGVPRGAEVAWVLRALRDARLNSAVVDRDGEAMCVQDWVNQKGGMAWLQSSSS
jgi:tRNA nucleotidyltransferase (CCA-adding enzyme)